jgi:hypothetical protein
MSKNGLGICIDAGHADRANPLLNNGSIAATFQNNVVSSSSLNSSILSFTSYLAALKPQQLLVADALSTIPPSYKYLQQSTYTLTHTGELSGVWIDHPVQDPVDCRTLCNILQINGVDMPPPIRSAGLGPAFLQSFVPMAPFPSACPPPLPQPLPQCAPQL